MTCNWLCRTCGEEIERVPRYIAGLQRVWAHAREGVGHHAQPASPEFYTVTVNMGTVVLDGASFEEGAVRIPSWGLGEQCEFCGTSVTEGCEVVMVKTQTHFGASLPYRIKCQCGATYDAKPARMVNDWVTDLEEP